ncbi:MAG: HigA family addiction module antitoxin [Chloroflexota bacterium]
MISENRPTHPGEFVREDILEEFSLTQAELAEKLGVSRRTINQLVNEKRGVSADMALRLGQLTQTTPQLWLNLQMAVDLWDAYHATPFKPFNEIQALVAH